MKTLNVEVPEALLLQSSASLEDLSKEAQRECALFYFREGRLTSGQAAEMARMNRVDFMLLAGSRKIPLIDLDEEDLAAEFNSL